MKLLLKNIDNADIDVLLAYYSVSRTTHQNDPLWTCYFSPWNKGRVLRVSNGHRLGGLYASRRWEETGGLEENCGYGAMSLVARLMGLDNTMDHRRVVCRAISDITERPQKWLGDDAVNGITELTDPQNELTFVTSDDFSVEAIECLGCRVERLYRETETGRRIPLNEGGNPVFKFSFGPGFKNRSLSACQFDLDRLHRDFGLYEVEEYTTRKFWDNQLEVSLRRKSHPLFPVFAVLRTAKGTDEKEYRWGELLQPEWSGEDGKGCECRRFPYQEVYDRGFLPHPFYTDSVCTFMLDGTNAEEAVQRAGSEEVLVTRKTVVAEDENGKLQQEEVEMSPDEVKVSNMVICQDALGAVCAYYALSAIHSDYGYNPKLKNLHFHVAWKSGRSDWKDYDFCMLRKLSMNAYLIFNSDMSGKRNAFKVCKVNPEVRMAMLPERLSEMFNVYRGGTMCKATDVRSFFTSYCMTEDENISYSSDLNLLFLSFLTGSLPVNPFIKRVSPGKNKTKDKYEYRIDSACLWNLMATEGYCREVTPDSSDMVGKYIHVDGCFVRELDPRSIAVAASNSLRNYARKWAETGTDEYQKMMQAVSTCRDITELRATSLPSVELNYRGGFNAKLDHFFYRNGALRITPDEIKFIPYSQIQFSVDRSEILPFDFRMPCARGEEPFRIYENAEYAERLGELEKHRRDTEHYTQVEIQQEERELQVWSQTNRWKFDFRGKKPSEWWEPLQVIRCFANEEYEEEMELNRSGQGFSEDQERMLYARMANILYSLGRPLFRYRGGGTSYMPYITENRNSLNDRAEGGSGKSVFVNVFMGCSGKIYHVNGRGLRPDSDIALSLDKFEPRANRVVHWEDWPNGVKIDPLYNYITSGFVYRHRHNDSMYVPFSESPGHVITSNYQQTYEDPSSSGRVVPTGFSHFFNRGNTRKNKPERKISAVMPGLRDDPADICIELRSQIAYINALAVQFCMKTSERVLPPMSDLNERSQKKAMGDMFITWAKDFFSRDSVFLCPIDLKTIFSDYVDLCDTSDDKKNKFSANTFRKKIVEYCGDNGYVCNPDICLDSITERRNGYMRVKAWCKTVYFADESVWGPGKRKEIRELRHSQQCLFFIRTEEEAKKMTAEQVHDLCKAFYLREDPSPCIDPETGLPYVLTDDERTDWDIYMLKKQGNYAKANKLSMDRGIASVDLQPEKKGEAEAYEQLPF